MNAALAALRRDNLRLMQELVDSQRSYQDALKAALSEQQVNRQLVRQLARSPDEGSFDNTATCSVIKYRRV